MLKNIINTKTIILIVVALLATNMILYQTRKVSPMFNMIFSPSDLHDDIGKFPISFDKKGIEHKVSFKNKYPGLHWYRIYHDKIGVDYEENFRVRLKITSTDGKIYILEDIDGKRNTDLFWYRVPEDLPLRTPLIATITILKEDLHYNYKYGNAKIIIEKLSDE